MGRKSIKEIRRKEIVRAFYKVAKKEGLENASIAKVAKQLDINPSLIIHYFNTKEELIFGLIEYILERYRLIYKPKKNIGDSKKQLQNIIQTLFSRKWGGLFDDGVFYSCYALIFRDKKIKEHFQALHQSLRSMLTEVIREARHDGHVEVDNPELTADLIFVMVEGAYYYHSFFDGHVGDRIQRYQKEAFRMLNLKE